MSNSNALSTQEPRSVGSKTFTSAISPSSETDTQVGEPARKVERTDRLRLVGILKGLQQSVTSATRGLLSGTDGGGTDLQKLIAIGLTAVGGLLAVGMVTRAVLLNRAARRTRIADFATEATDPYYDREFYRKLREDNFAQRP